MKKEHADNLITQYQKKIFGFAISRTSDIQEAEELAAEISCETYTSFLKTDLITNPDGYVWRIARHVYSRYVADKKKFSFSDISDISLPYNDGTQENLESSETLSALKQEISFLSQRQRTVIYLHYYKKLTVYEIAERLEISEGTVKWHLSDARTTLKEGISMNKTNENLNINPIAFISMGHDGTAGSNGDTNQIFDTRLKQNIAWCCYHTPRTVNEIARELSVPPVFIADELNILEEYGYIDRLDSSKKPLFRTNMFIIDARETDGSNESNIKDELYSQAAQKLCAEFFPKIFKDFDADPDCWGFSCGSNDKNFMKYTLVMLCTRLLLNNDCDMKEWDRLTVARPDGGKFIARAVVADDCRRSAQIVSPYWVIGFMGRGSESVGSIQLNCRFSDRNGDWGDNVTEDWEYYRSFVKNGCNITKTTPEQYKRLCDKGYIYNDIPQVMTAEINYNNNIYEALEQLLRSKIDVPKQLISYGRDLDEQSYLRSKDKYPEHILPILRFYSTGILASPNIIPYIIEEMLDSGMLLPLTDIQKKNVFTIAVIK